MKRIFVLVSVLALTLVASGVLFAQSNPFFGTWKLNVAKSKLSGDAPKSVTLTVAAYFKGEKISVEALPATGSAVSYGYSSNLDGKDSPISGTPPFGADTIAVKLVDANSHTGIYRKAGKQLVTLSSAVSKDGKVLTIILKGTDAQGQSVNETTVWDKQ